MSLDDNTYELIDQYLQGELPEDHPFVQRLKHDKELALEVEVHRSISDAVVDYRLKAVEKLVVNRRKEFIDQNSKKGYWGLLALSILIVGTCTYLYTFLGQKEQATASKGIPPTAHILPKTSTQVYVDPFFAPSTDKSTKVLNTKKKEAAKNNPKELEVPVSDAPKNAPTTPTERIHSPIAAAAPEQRVESVPQKEIIPASPTNPCIGIRMKAFVQELRPCMGTSEGYLNIKEVRGGKPPYQFSLDGKRFQEESKFMSLRSGEYDIVVKDVNGCQEVVYEKYPLSSKNCVQFSEHVFNPNFTTWEVPNNQEKKGELTIFDGNGHRVYFRSFEKAETLNWGGTQNSGELLIPGAYIYTIKYSDGVVEQGRITITY